MLQQPLKLGELIHYARRDAHRHANAPEQRVLGCLIEKRFTTPDQYPLTLNALRLACNQSTNRDPVVDYDEETVRAAAQRLAQYGVARLASGHTSRATKYRHLAEEALGLGREQLAVLSVLLLRGPQTPGELKGRTERIVAVAVAGRRRAGAGRADRSRLRGATRAPPRPEGGALRPACSAGSQMERLRGAGGRAAGGANAKRRRGRAQPRMVRRAAGGAARRTGRRQAALEQGRAARRAASSTDRVSRCR